MFYLVNLVLNFGIVVPFEAQPLRLRNQGHPALTPQDKLGTCPL